MTPFWDSVEPLEPIAPGQADEPDGYPIENRCWCGRLLVRTAGGTLWCLRHEEKCGPWSDDD